MLDRYAHANRWRRTPAADKLVLAVGLLTVALAAPPWPGAAVVLAVVFGAATFGARLPVAVVLKALALPAGFLLAGLPALAMSVDGSGLSFPAEGWTRAVAVSGRALAAAGALVLLALTTPLPDLARLATAARVPPVLIEMLMLTYRLIFVLLDALAAGRRAQAARGGDVSWRRAVDGLGGLAAAIFGRAQTRARRMERGLAARGHDGRLAVLSPTPLASAPGLIVALLTVAGTAVAAWSVAAWAGTS